VRARCRTSFPFWFQNCVKIPVKDKSGEELGLSYIKMNALQRRIEEALEQQQADNAPMRTITGKVRQNGSSRYHMCRAYWMGRNLPRSIAVIADDKLTTPKMLAMWEKAWMYDHMTTERWGNSASVTGFPRKFSHGTELSEETANDPRAGQGGTLDILISTETAHYKSKGESNGEAVFQSIASTVADLPHTWMALESTANGQQGVYYATYQQSASLAEWRNGMRKNGFIRSFAAWWEADDYVDVITPRQAGEIMDSLNEEEIRLISKFGPQNITPPRLAWRRRILASPKISNDVQKFNQEYPCDEKTMFISTGSQVFDEEGLEYLESLTDKNLPKFGLLANKVFTATDVASGWCRIWEHPREGARYVMSCDFMEGENADGTRDPDCHSVSVWRDRYMDDTGKEHNVAKVAAIKIECRVNMDVLVRWIAELYHYYGDCLVCPEVSGAMGIIALLLSVGVSNIVAREVPKEQRRIGEGKLLRKRGWITNEGSREMIIANLQRMIREQLLDSWCPRFLAELKQFVTKTNGRKEAAPGNHDDTVMEAAIGIYHLPAATRYTEFVPVVQRHHLDHQPENTPQWGQPLDPGLGVAG